MSYKETAELAKYWRKLALETPTSSELYLKYIRKYEFYLNELKEHQKQIQEFRGTTYLHGGYVNALNKPKTKISFIQRFLNFFPRIFLTL